MRRVRLGRTDLKVPQIGFGGIPITRPSDLDAQRTIQRAIELGVGFFDSATGYGGGESEIRIGKGVDGHRSEVIIASKTDALSAARTHDDIQRSLRQLNTNYLDIYQLGNITTPKKFDRVMRPGGSLDGLKQALSEGKINHIGLSTHNLSIARDAVCSGEFETVQVILNLLAQEAAVELLDLARENDVGVIAMKPFGAGMIMEARLAINYLLQFDIVINPGIETSSEIEEIVNLADNYTSISSTLQRELDSYHKQYSKEFCRHCEMCLPCPNGVNIPSMIYLRAARRLRSSEWYTRGAEKTIEGYAGCSGCGECESRCPFGIPIREHMMKSFSSHQAITSY